MNKDNLHNKIKESFEKQYFSAPDNIWSNISDKLEYISQSDKIIDEKIKQSFNSVNKTAPEYIWNNVNKQLTIDRVWNHISKILNRRQLIYRTSKKVSFILLLLLLVSGGYMYNYNVNDTAENIKTINKKSLSKKNINIKRNNIFLDKKKTVLNKDMKIKKQNTKTMNNTLNNENKKTNNIEIKQDSYYMKTEKKPKRLIPSTDKKHEPMPFLSAIPPVLFSEIEDMNFVFPEIELPNKNIKNILPKYKPFSIGFVYQYDNTWLVNNETRAAFDKTSLVSADYSFIGSYAAYVNYAFSPLNEISTEFFIRDKIIQNYNAYLEGKYLRKKTELNYSKIAVLYKRNFFIKKSKFSIATGVYVAKLNTEYKYLDNRIIYSENLYDIYDYGIKLNVGKELDLGQFVLGYGLNTEYGLKNIFTGGKNMKAEFDITNTAKIGVYLSLKYKIY